MGGRIAVLTVLEGTTDADAAKDVAMHVAAINPKYVSRDKFLQEEIEREREVLTQQALNEGKPEKIVAKMVEGRLRKISSKKFVCMIKLSLKILIKKLVNLLNLKVEQIREFVRYEVGEGLEKREENFAEEVMNQVKK